MAAEQLAAGVSAEEWWATAPGMAPRAADGELAFYACYGPAVTPLVGLVRVAGTRWAVEEGFEQAKGEVGLDHYKVRRWSGWYRHVTLALLAHAFLAVTRAQAVSGEGARGPVAA